MKHYCVTLGLLGHIDDLLLDQIALLSLRLANIDGLVGQLHMQRVGVRVGEDGHTLDAESIGSSYDTAGDFTSIGDQDLAQCHLFFTNLALEVRLRVGISILAGKRGKKGSVNLDRVTKRERET